MTLEYASPERLPFNSTNKASPVQKRTFLCVLILMASGAFAYARAMPADEIRTLPAVQGEAGLPQVWMYRRGDKKVWILGSVTTIPRNTIFDSSEVSRKIAAANSIVGPPGQAVGENIGVFRALTLWSSIHKKKLNKDGTHLTDVLAPATYARWQALRSRLPELGNGIERLRPMYAAYELFRSVSSKLAISDASPATNFVREVAGKLGRDVIDARFHLPVSDARATVGAFEVSTAEDIACLERTMTAVDDLLSNMPRLRDAWATGDVPGLKEAIARSPTVDYCWATLTNQAIARNEGVVDLTSATNASWLRTLKSALSEGDSVFTVLPASDLVTERGAVALLKQDGFVLEEPAMRAQADFR